MSIILFPLRPTEHSLLYTLSYVCNTSLKLRIVNKVLMRMVNKIILLFTENSVNGKGKTMEENNVQLNRAIKALCMVLFEGKPSRLQKTIDKLILNLLNKCKLTNRGYNPNQVRSAPFTHLPVPTMAWRPVYVCALV